MVAPRTDLAARNDVRASRAQFARAFRVATYLLGVLVLRTSDAGLAVEPVAKKTVADFLEQLGPAAGIAPEVERKAPMNDTITRILMPVDFYVPDVPELLKNLISDAERQLATLKDSAAALGVAADTAVLTRRPAHTIVEHAREGGFDLIVIGTHGRTGLSQVVRGNVAERVVRKAHCPVVTMRAAEPAATKHAAA
jgi:nucleotide-binding universal stress UspA family protein